MWIDDIRDIAKVRVDEPIDSMESLERFLIRWWCNYYKRPMKDPLLGSYTLEELALEFFEVYYTNNKDEIKDEEKLDKEKAEDDEWLDKQISAVPEKKEEKPVDFPDEGEIKF